MKAHSKIRPLHCLPRLMATLLWVFTQESSRAQLTPLDDQDLAGVTGQIAFYTNYIDPSATGNVSGLGFFSLGLSGIVALNANIEHLQLGCGGVNGSGCDIDLSQVRISGTTPGASGTYADSDATLGNPFLQLAIKNPTSLANRQIVGIALGAQNVDALLSIGANPTPNTPGTPGGTVGGETGINTLSGSFEAQIQDLRNPLVITLAGAPVASGTAYIQSTATQPTLSTTLPTTDNLGNTVNTGAYYQYVSGSRITGVKLGAISLVVPDLTALGFIPVPLNVTATATYSPINLIDLHNLNVSSNKNAGLLLSLNSQAILWPQVGSLGISTFPTVTQNLGSNGTPTTTAYNSNGSAVSINQLMAQPGWWLSVPQSTIGNPQTGFITTSSITEGAVATAAGLIVGLNVPSVNTQQIPVQNCFGGLKFC